MCFAVREFLAVVHASAPPGLAVVHRMIDGRDCVRVTGPRGDVEIRWSWHGAPWRWSLVDGTPGGDGIGGAGAELGALLGAIA